MNSYEKKEIDTLPDKYRPLTAWNYFWLSILFNIPVLGFIFLIVFSCSSGNINLRSYARSYFCWLIILVVIIIAIIVLGGGVASLTDILNKVNLLK